MTACFQKHCVGEPPWLSIQRVMKQQEGPDVPPWTCTQFSARDTTNFPGSINFTYSPPYMLFQILSSRSRPLCILIQKAGSQFFLTKLGLVFFTEFKKPLFIRLIITYVSKYKMLINTGQAMKCKIFQLRVHSYKGNMISFQRPMNNMLDLTLIFIFSINPK